MTALDTYSEKSFRALSKSTLKEIRGVILYYLTTGRNAWHSTWVTHYWDRCMHNSSDSAKASAERLRVQGTVFTIKQLPAIQFISDHGCLIVSQINTTNPLEHYSADATSKSVPRDQKKIKGARDNYFEIGAPILGAALSFDRRSRFWRTPPPPRHSVFLLASSESDLALEPLGNNKLESFVSFSHGGNYLLGWSKRENHVSAKAVRALARQRNES